MNHNSWWVDMTSEEKVGITWIDADGVLCIDPDSTVVNITNGTKRFRVDYKDVYDLIAELNRTPQP